MVGYLSGLLLRGPLWVAGNFPFPGNPSSYHAVVIGAVGRWRPGLDHAADLRSLASEYR